MGDPKPSLESHIELNVDWAQGQIRSVWQSQQQSLKCRLATIRDLQKAINDHRQAAETEIASVEQIAKSIKVATNNVLIVILVSNGVADRTLPAWHKNDLNHPLFSTYYATFAVRPSRYSAPCCQ